MEGGRIRTYSPTYLWWSILNTIFCCLPLGIAAIVFSCKTQNANEVGNSSSAQDASRTAKKLNIIAFVCGIIVIIIVATLKSLT